MTNLSPAAQAVLNAYRDESWTPDEEDNGKYYKFCHKAGMAAALRAAADHLGYLLPFEDSACVDVADLLAIANELEAQ
jgi:hypothetical protein